MLKPCKKDKKGQGRPGRVVEEEEDEDGGEKGQAGGDAKSPSEVEESYSKEEAGSFHSTSILMEPLREQSQDHCQ